MGVQNNNYLLEEETKNLTERDALDTQNIKNNKKEYNETDPLQKDAEGTEKTIKKRSYRQTCCHIIRNVTVEVTMFIYIIPCILSVLTSQNLNIEKACRVNLNISSEICDALRKQTLGEQNEYERDVQYLVAKAMSWKTYITATVPCILALFIGSWSDITGRRKCFILLPITGQILLCLNGVINTYFLTELNLEMFVFSEAILEGFTGSWCVCILTLYAYISAVTTDDNRTFRMGLVSFSLTVGFPIGMGISGILLRKIGFYGCYGISLSLQLINLLYTVFILKDTQRTTEQKLTESDHKNLRSDKSLRKIYTRSGSSV